MSIGAPPACSLIYSSRSREGKVRGSRGGSSKHGHYTCKYSTFRFSSAFPLSAPVYFPTANEPVIILPISGHKAEKYSSCRPIPAAGASSAGCLHPCACPAGPARAPGAVCRQSRCPHLPARLCGNPGAPGLARGHVLHLGQRTKPVLHLPANLSRLPRWSIHHFSKVASHGDKPSRNACGVGRGCWGGGVLLIYLLELLLLRSPARKRGMHWPPLCSGALLGGASQPWYFWL